MLRVSSSIRVHVACGVAGSRGRGVAERGFGRRPVLGGCQSAGHRRITPPQAAIAGWYCGPPHYRNCRAGWRCSSQNHVAIGLCGGCRGTKPNGDSYDAPPKIHVHAIAGLAVRTDGRGPDRLCRSLSILDCTNSRGRRLCNQGCSTSYSIGTRAVPAWAVWTFG